EGAAVESDQSVLPTALHHEASRAGRAAMLAQVRALHTHREDEVAFGIAQEHRRLITPEERSQIASAGEPDCESLAVTRETCAARWIDRNVPAREPRTAILVWRPQRGRRR